MFEKAPILKNAFFDQNSDSIQKNIGTTLARQKARRTKDVKNFHSDFSKIPTARRIED